MPLFHCRRCHHEWEGIAGQVNCDWCGAYGYIIEEETVLEKFLKDRPGNRLKRVPERSDEDPA